MEELKSKSDLRQRLYVGEIFALNFIFIVSALALLHFNSEHEAALQAALYMLIASLVISFIYSAVATFRYSFKFNLRKSILITATLTILGLIFSQIIGALIAG